MQVGANGRNTRKTNHRMSNGKFASGQTLRKARVVFHTLALKIVEF